MLEHPPLSFDAEGPTRIDWEDGYRLDDSFIAHGIGTALGPRMSDLLDIAVAASLIDRLYSRRPPGSRNSDHWSRRLSFQIAVREPGFWADASVTNRLCELLTWLTDDEWDISFTGDRSPRHAQSQIPLFTESLQDPVKVGLFSGGLDSYLGAAADLQQAGELVLVSAATSPSLGALQRITARALSRGPTQVRSIRVPASLRMRTVRDISGTRDAPEPSQRTRGLLFLALGAVTATTLGVPELRVYENGVGAMNLPLTAAQYGSHNTRAMRPETMVAMAELVSVAAQEAFMIVNPSFARTKAELVAELAPELRDGIDLTVSCDTGLTYRSSTTRWCGTCTSCLLRRQSLRAGGRADCDHEERDRYRIDARGVSKLSDPANLRLHYMLNQAAQFDRALRDARPLEALLRAFPDLARIHRALARLGYADPAQVTHRLLDAYAAEWQHFGHPLVERYLPSRLSVPA